MCIDASISVSVSLFRSISIFVSSSLHPPLHIRNPTSPCCPPGAVILNLAKTWRGPSPRLGVEDQVSAVHGFGAELEAVVSATSPPPTPKRGRGLGEGACGRGGGGFPSGCDCHSCIQGRGGRGTLAVRLNARPLLPPLFLPHPPSVRSPDTGSFLHSMAFINVFIYTLHRPCSV